MSSLQLPEDEILKTAVRRLDNGVEDALVDEALILKSWPLCFGCHFQSKSVTPMI